MPLHYQCDVIVTSSLQDINVGRSTRLEREAAELSFKEAIRV